MKSIHSVLLLFFALSSAFRHQLLDWPNRIRWSMRFILRCTFTALAAAFALPFGQLPSDWPDLVIGNLASVPGAFSAFMLIAFFTIGMGMLTLAQKVSNTL